MRLERSDSPNKIGSWWWTVDRLMLTAVALLMVIGLALLGTASPNIGGAGKFPPFYFVTHQLANLTVGIALMVGVSLLDENWIRRMGFLGFIACIVLLILVYFFGTEIKGSRRWLYVFGTSIQPSELIKPFFAIVNAFILAKGASSNRNRSFAISLSVMLLVAALVVFQPDIGMTATLVMMWGVQLFVAGLNGFIIAGLLVVGAAGLTGAYFFFPHVAHRINTFLDPASGDNYQIGKSLDAIMRGGFTGNGPGEGVISEKLPDSHTDFIFAAAAEQFGALFCMGLALIFAFVLFRGFYKVYRESNLFVFYTVIGVLAVFSLQSIINMSVTLSLVPNKGMTLPFISYGGSAMITASINIGVVLALTRKRYGAIVRRPVMG